MVASGFCDDRKSAFRHKESPTEADADSGLQNPLCFAVYFIHLLISRCDDMGRNIQLPFAIAIGKMPFGNNFQVQQHIGQTKGR